MTVTVYIGLGSNQGEREDLLKEAMQAITERVGRITASSSVRETEPYGVTMQGRFLNAVIAVETELSPLGLLDVLQRIEAEAGRVRTLRWGPRTLDLDIIFYDNLIMDTERLTLPHPDFRNRFFVLEPLAEIAPDRKDPVTGKTVRELLRNLKQRSEQEELLHHAVIVTDRRLVRGDFTEAMVRLIQRRPAGFLLREKDWPESDYRNCAIRLAASAAEYEVPFIVHGRQSTAMEIGCRNLHLTFSDFQTANRALKEFDRIGVSVHSSEEAKQAEAGGASYVLYGHVFPSSCKPGLPPRGLEAVAEMAALLKIPVYAIGGIDETNYRGVLAQGAEKVAIRSLAMEMAMD